MPFCNITLSRFSIIEYSFNSALENDQHPDLVSVTLVQLNEGKVIKGHKLRCDNVYEVLEYHYESDRINFIEQKVWWTDTYFERNYKVTYNGNVLIEEILNDGKTVKIYP